MTPEESVEEETINEMFSDKSNEIIGFVSTWKQDKLSTLVESQIQTDPLPVKKSQSTATNEPKEMATQTEVLQMRKVAVDEEKLGNWLRTILPSVERELLKGVTNVFEMFSSLGENGRENISLFPVQTINCSNESVELMKLINQGSAAWLSVSTKNAPILAVAGSLAHQTWCDHAMAEVKVFVPMRSTNNSTAVIYKELKTLPVKSCCQALRTNQLNKDWLAGGTFSGDLYIWRYTIKASGEGNIEEQFSETSQYGSIVGIAWLKAINNQSDFELLTCHTDGMVVLWKVGTKQMVRDKIFSIASRKDKMELATLTSICPISSNEFVVGTDDGSILVCSTTQALPLKDNKHMYDPILTELEAHKFAISTLINLKWKSQILLISCDISGDIYFRYTDETTEPWQTVKMPLPFKNKIVCSNILEHIFTPNENGALDIFNIETTTRKTINGSGDMYGHGDTIAISDNGSWICTGCYEGKFQIFEVQND